LIPLPIEPDELYDATDAALTSGFPPCARYHNPGTEGAVLGLLAKWTAASLLAALMEHDAVGGEAEAALGRAEAHLTWQGWDRARVQSWLEDVRSIAAAHAQYGAKA
jgi:hypothetical protein